MERSDSICKIFYYVESLRNTAGSVSSAIEIMDKANWGLLIALSFPWWKKLVYWNRIFSWARNYLFWNNIPHTDFADLGHTAEQPKFSSRLWLSKLWSTASPSLPYPRSMFWLLGWRDKGSGRTVVNRGRDPESSVAGGEDIQRAHQKIADMWLPVFSPLWNRALAGCLSRSLFSCLFSFPPKKKQSPK